MQNVKLNICDGFSSLYYESCGSDRRRAWERMRRNTKHQQNLASHTLNVTVQCKPMQNYVAYSGMASGLICLANYTGCRSMLMPLTVSMTQVGIPTWALWCLMSIWAFLELVTRWDRQSVKVSVDKGSSMLSVYLYGQYTLYIIIFGEDRWVICQWLLIPSMCKTSSLTVWLLTVNKEHPSLCRGFIGCI